MTKEERDRIAGWANVGVDLSGLQNVSPFEKGSLHQDLKEIRKKLPKDKPKPVKAEVKPEKPLWQRAFKKD